MGIDDDIQKLKEKLEETPVNKATETERGRLKARIAELKEEREKRSKETGGGYTGYSAEKKGDATVALVGPPSVGKSTLLNQITNADSETGSYEFTTLEVVPGMLEYRGAKIQLLDVPGLIGGAAQGKGGGKQVLSVVRNSDLVLMMASPEKLSGFEEMEQELYDAGLRLDQEPPEVKITRKDSGGMTVKSTVDQSGLDMETVEELLREKGLVNASVILREDLDLDRLVDALSDNREYMPSVRAINKVDEVSEGEMEDLEDQFPGAVMLSSETGEGVEELKKRIWEKLRFMRVYMKKPGKDPDREEPLIVDRGSTIGEVLDTLAGDFSNFKHARIWGSSADFPEQKVGEDHVLQDEDVVELRTK
ncbi:MAG: 50S ribosome-binding GTPase [Candidatus Nanohaloarchaeota archaeon QJJ-7]|nr:50S ribosome-binding GTPase [Candidatus Nanohaloarchaeota archaeon QJJ-7]